MTTATASSPEAGASPNQSAPLPAHTAVYEVLRRGSSIGEVHVSLSQSDSGLWHFDTETVATSRVARLARATAEESAWFAWHDDRVQLLSYRQVTRALGRSRYWQHELDWQANQSQTRTYEGDYLIELEPDIVDPLTLRLQLAVLLANPDLRGQDLPFRVLERNEIEDQQFFYLGEETLEVPAGCFEAVRMERFRREGSSRNYHSWHAEDFHWLPLRIVQFRDDEEELDIRLMESSIELDPDCNV